MYMGVLEARVVADVYGSARGPCCSMTVQYRALRSVPLLIIRSIMHN